MVFQIVSVLVPVGLLMCMPRVLRYIGAHDARRTPLLYIACAVFFVSWYLPTFAVRGEDTAFVTHFVGGGVFSALLWLYIKRALNWQGSVLVELSIVYALVSALGVANELFELALYWFEIVDMTVVDTSYDLFANTTGAGCTMAMYYLARLLWRKK